MTDEGQREESGGKAEETCPHCGCSHYGKNQVPACEGHKRTLKQQAKDAGLVGIKGWLWFPVYGWIGNSVFLTLKDIYVTAGTDPYMIGIALLFLPLLGAVGVLAALHHKWFKWAWIGVFGTITGIDLLILAVPEIAHTAEERSYAIVMFSWVIIWSIYLLVSKRVKKTFTRSGPAVRVCLAAGAISLLGFVVFAYNFEEPWEITLLDGTIVYLDDEAEERVRSGERVRLYNGVILHLEDGEIIQSSEEPVPEMPPEQVDAILKELMEKYGFEEGKELLGDSKPLVEESEGSKE